ncbi:MAG: hypothetical protein AAF604_11560 [Acidobacteriota bacterium]
MSYHASTLRRFYLWALPLLILAIAFFQSVVENPTAQVPATTVVGAWVLEAIALTALFALLAERGGNLLLTGLYAGWIGWLFRGPVAVLAAAAAGAPPRPLLWPLAQRSLLLYTIAGLLLAAAAWASGLRKRSDQP